MDIRIILQLTGMLFIPVLVAFIPIIIGQKAGMYMRTKSEQIKEVSIDPIVGAAFALLAFMLAITFQIVSNRWDSRKELLLEEVTNIRTTYLRAGLLKEPMSSEAKKLLVEYTDIRYEFSIDNSKLNNLLTRSPQILDELWKFSEELAEEDRSSEVYALFTQSVNDLVDNFNQRVTMSLEYRLPPVILWILGIIAFFSMITYGFQVGVTGKGNFWLNLILSIVFAIVMFLILLLDRPETGVAKLNQKPVVTLYQQLNSK
jgi:hypothetical protein